MVVLSVYRRERAPFHPNAVLCVRALALVGNMAALQHGGRYGAGIEHMARDSPESPFRWRARAPRMTVAEKIPICRILLSCESVTSYQMCISVHYTDTFIFIMLGVILNGRLADVNGCLCRGCIKVSINPKSFQT